MRLFHEVLAIEGDEGEFVVKGVAKRRGREKEFSISTLYVIVATGYYDNPRGLGGVPGEKGSNTNYYYTEPHPFYDQDVVVIGGGNSGAEAALELYRHGARVTLIHNKPSLKKALKYWVEPDLIISTYFVVLYRLRCNTYWQDDAATIPSTILHLSILLAWFGVWDYLFA